ncbi:class I SAM-dependent methyltransferase [Hirschia baltica]|uniref:SAM dependent methyltransferase n=1 Tax=Hirschia baltica (strain ATCC 49814 / DSM 5838 / IFAM 1418) TaxID=582402 RepID=C6XJZ7_HIRBI|nr:class I SAM-dependent methyltransferase [Hirschia baltica]ACT59442.1 SAM dependent methyltransferase [Hirschia baltica ATCC 49814]
MTEPTNNKKAPNGKFKLLSASDWKDYKLLDCGHGRKLEKFGNYTFDRPDSQALWPPQRPIDEWEADGIFRGGDHEDKGAWSFKGKQPPESWPMNWKGLQIQARCAAFRHMGLFPEHSVHWNWAVEKIRNANRPTRVLNLFGYTGVASLACAQAGAEVVHLDASPKSIGYGKENQELSDLNNKTIRWICDDALKFLKREERRGRTYDGIILDPPKYGRGPKKEVWQLDEGLDELLGLIRSVLAPDPLFVILTIYAVRLSYIAVGQALASQLSGLGGGLEWGEMSLPEEGRGFDLPTAVYARWSSDL